MARKPDVRAKLMDAFLQLKPWPDSVEAIVLNRVRLLG